MLLSACSLVQSNLNYPNLDYKKPRLSEHGSRAKVQVKVQMPGMISMCACAVECSAAIVRYVRANDKSAKLAYKKVM